MITIESAANPRFRAWQSLLEASGIRKARRALLSGRKVIDELLRDDPERVLEVLLPPKAEPLSETIRHTRLSAPLFQTLDEVGTRSPLAVIAAPELKPWTPAPPRGLELILALSDPNNLGACLRSAEAFGVTRVILTRECSSPYLPRALRSAAGSTLRLELLRTGPLAEVRSPCAYGLDAGGERLEGTTFPPDLHLVLGEEGRGLPESMNVKRVSITMRGRIESLNATVAASIAMHAHASQIQNG